MTTEYEQRAREIATGLQSAYEQGWRDAREAAAVVADTVEYHATDHTEDDGPTAKEIGKRIRALTPEPRGSGECSEWPGSRCQYITEDRKQWCASCLAQPPASPGGERGEAIFNAVTDALEAAGLMYHTYEDGSSYRLLDLVTPDGQTVDIGQEELAVIAGDVACAVEDALRPDLPGRSPNRRRDTVRHANDRPSDPSLAERDAAASSRLSGACPGPETCQRTIAALAQPAPSREHWSACTPGGDGCSGVGCRCWCHDAVSKLLGVIDAHEIASLSCDRDGEAYCECVTDAVAKFRHSYDSPQEATHGQR